MLLALSVLISLFWNVFYTVRSAAIFFFCITARTSTSNFDLNLLLFWDVKAHVLYLSCTVLTISFRNSVNVTLRCEAAVFFNNTSSISFASFEYESLVLLLYVQVFYASPTIQWFASSLETLEALKTKSMLFNQVVCTFSAQLTLDLTSTCHEACAVSSLLQTGLTVSICFWQSWAVLRNLRSKTCCYRTKGSWIGGICPGGFLI